MIRGLAGALDVVVDSMAWPQCIFKKAVAIDLVWHVGLHVDRVRHTYLLSRAEWYGGFGDQEVVGALAMGNAYRSERALVDS